MCMNDTTTWESELGEWNVQRLTSKYIARIRGILTWGLAALFSDVST